MIGVLLTEKIVNRFGLNKQKFYQILVLIVTFIVYSVYHMARRPLSVVKSELHEKNCSDEVSERKIDNYDPNNTYWCDWTPFDTDNANTMLGLLDTSYLVTYALMMFVAGYIAERSNLRYFLTISLIVCGVLCIAFGIAYPLKIHNLYYFVIIQILTGIAQSTGWPGVVASVGNWFGSNKRGLIFGIWSLHTSVGNILGATIAGIFVEINWGYSFYVPGVILFGTAIIVFVFLIPNPKDVGIIPENNKNKDDSDDKKEENDKHKADSAISFLSALKLPGVIEFSICLFFAKLVSYTFLYWLPVYINSSIKVSPEQSAYLSIPFDIGGCVGAIAAGYISDKTGASAITCVTMLSLAIPSLLFYYWWGTISMVSNECLQFIAGVFVNGPYSLIITAVTTELATTVTSKSALATVSAIIDGTGSIGAAIGPALAGYLSDFGWQYVFYFVMFTDLLAVISLTRIGFNDFKRLREKYNNNKNNQNNQNSDIYNL